MTNRPAGIALIVTGVLIMAATTILMPIVANNQAHDSNSTLSSQLGYQAAVSQETPLFITGGFGIGILLIVLGARQLSQQQQ